MKLGDIAWISTGLVISRKKADYSPIQIYKMITLKSFEENGWINKEDLDDFHSSEILSKQYLTQKGDVVIRLSSPNTAIFIEKQEEGMVIPSLFVVIRAEVDKVLPEFLAIYLNAQNTKKKLSQVSIGSAIPIIKASTVKELEIQIPSLDHQEKVIRLHRLIQKEKRLLSELIKEKEKMYHAIIDQVIEGGSKNGNYK